MRHRLLGMALLLSFVAGTPLKVRIRVNQSGVDMEGKLGRGWVKGKLGDFLTLQRGFDLPEYERLPGTVPVVTSAGINGTHSEAKVRGPGVVMGRYGTLGQIYYIEQDFWPHNTSLYVKDFKGNYPRFVYYFLRIVNYDSHNDKSSVPGLNRNHLHLVDVIVPPLPEQRAIARILGALDDKIELNRKTNATLEAMARALFQSWFVDFDPVRAKAAGRAPYGMDAATAALFPDGFEVIDGREVPRGWQRGVFGEIAENPRRGAKPDDVLPDTPYIGLEHMPRKSISLGDWASASEVISNKFRFERGEILFGKLRPYFHKVGVAVVDGVCSTDILVIRPKHPTWYGLVLFHASSDSFISHTIASSDGTKMPRTNWSDMARFEIAIPPINLGRRFNQIIEPMVDKIRANILAARTLAALRDTLLPKLLSGELRVPEAMRMVEEVV